MIFIEQLTSNEHCETDAKTTTSTCAINDLIKKNKQSFAKEINSNLLTLNLLKVMYNE
jgi:hypothetical protein